MRYTGTCPCAKRSQHVSGKNPNPATYLHTNILLSESRREPLSPYTRSATPAQYPLAGPVAQSFTLLSTKHTKQELPFHVPHALPQRHGLRPTSPKLQRTCYSSYKFTKASVTPCHQHITRWLRAPATPPKPCAMGLAVDKAPSTITTGHLGCHLECPRLHARYTLRSPTWLHAAGTASSARTSPSGKWAPLPRGTSLAGRHHQTPLRRPGHMQGRFAQGGRAALTVRTQEPAARMPRQHLMRRKVQRWRQSPRPRSYSSLLQLVVAVARRRRAQAAAPLRVQRVRRSVSAARASPAPRRLRQGGT